MSTILKALRRLEEEKAAAAPRELRAEVAAVPQAVARSRSRLWLWLPALALVGLLAIAGAWWKLGRSEAGALEPVVPVVVETEVPSNIGVGAEPVIRTLAVLAAEPELRALTVAPAAKPPAPEATGLPDRAFSSSVEVVDRPVAKPRIPMEEPAAPVTNAPRAPEPPIATAETLEAPLVAADPELAAIPKPMISESQPVRSASLPDAVPAARAPDPFPKRKSREPELEPLADIAQSEPAATAEPIPSLLVEKTLWHPRPDRREAVIAVDGGATRRIHEGDVVGRTLVAEIQPSGVVFERDGETIRRGIGQR